MPGGCDVKVASIGARLTLWCWTCETTIKNWLPGVNFIRVDEVCEAVLAHLGSGFPFACGSYGCTCGACEK